MSVTYECDRCGSIRHDDNFGWAKVTATRVMRDGDQTREYDLCKECATEVFVCINSRIKRFDTVVEP